MLPEEELQYLRGKCSGLEEGVPLLHQQIAKLKTENERLKKRVQDAESENERLKKELEDRDSDMTVAYMSGVEDGKDRLKARVQALESVLSRLLIYFDPTNTEYTVNGVEIPVTEARNLLNKGKEGEYAT